MKISLYDLNIIVDTLLGSQSISDGGTLWKYTASAREKVAKRLLQEMSDLKLKIKVNDK